ncbi:hypothetical protein [Primorskyibacter flagellatus]|uniref:hypothetical protein n=1 Tax=Primorskyibacter flagellatus TaxID=1387277 RepID=UPI0015C420CE|nr:hypothetical protein [Primorskyibacter flagellatus]
MLKKMIVITVAIILGWVAGSLFPLGIWGHSDCHRLGGSLRATDGPGKAMECTIPWDTH